MQSVPAQMVHRHAIPCPKQTVQIICHFAMPYHWTQSALRVFVGANQPKNFCIAKLQQQKKQ